MAPPRHRASFAAWVAKRRPTGLRARHTYDLDRSITNAPTAAGHLSGWDYQHRPGPSPYAASQRFAQDDRRTFSDPTFGGRVAVRRPELAGHLQPLGQDADQIDGDLRITHRRLDRGRVAHIGLHGMDLPDPAERLKMAGQFGPPHGNTDPVIALAERPDHVPPQKPRSAEDRDCGVQVRCHGVVPVGFGSY